MEVLFVKGAFVIILSHLPLLAGRVAQNSWKQYKMGKAKHDFLLFYIMAITVNNKIKMSLKLVYIIQFLSASFWPKWLKMATSQKKSKSPKETL